MATDDGTIYRRFSDGDLNPLGDRSRNNAASIGDTWSALQRAATEVYRPSILNETGPYQAQVLMAFRDKAPPASFYDYGANSMQPPPSEMSGQSWSAIPSYDQRPQLPWIVARINELMGHLPDPANFNPSGSPAERYQYWAAISAHFDIGVFLPEDEDPDYPLPEPGTIIEVDYINTRSFKGGKYRYSGTQSPVGSFPLTRGGGFQHVLNIVHSEENGAEESTPAPVYEPDEGCIYERNKGGLIGYTAEYVWDKRGIDPLGGRLKPDNTKYLFTDHPDKGIHHNDQGKAMLAGGNLALGVDLSGHNGHEADKYDFPCMAGWESPEGLKVKWMITKVSDGGGRTEAGDRPSDNSYEEGNDDNYGGVEGYEIRAAGAYHAGLAVSYYHWFKPQKWNYPSDSNNREDSVRQRGRIEAENFCRKIMKCRLAIDAENPPMPDFEVWIDIEEDTDETNIGDAFRGKLFVVYMQEFIRIVEEVNGYKLGWYVNNDRLSDWVGIKRDGAGWDNIPESQIPTIEDLRSIFYQPSPSSLPPEEQLLRPYWVARYGQQTGLMWGPYGRSRDPNNKVFILFYRSEPRPDVAGGVAAGWDIFQFASENADYIPGHKMNGHYHKMRGDLPPEFRRGNECIGEDEVFDSASKRRHREEDCDNYTSCMEMWGDHNFCKYEASRALDVNVLRIDSLRFNFSDRFKRLLGLPVGSDISSTAERVWANPSYQL